MIAPQISDVIALVREFRPREPISAETRLDADLTITGSEAIELLEAAERRFDVAFQTDERPFSETFGLGPNEFLFGGEGLDLFGIFGAIEWLCGISPPIIRDLTIDEFHRAILRSPR